MLKRILNRIEARRYDRMFAFVEKHFESHLENAIENVKTNIEQSAQEQLFQSIYDRVYDTVDEDTIEATVYDAINEKIDNSVHFDIDEEARDHVREMVENHYFDDFDDMARSCVDERIDDNLELDDHAREAVETWFENYNHRIESMVDNAIEAQLAIVLEDEPHLVARIEELEGQLVEMTRRVVQLADTTAEFAERVEEELDSIATKNDIRRHARAVFTDMVAHVGRLLEADTYHHPAFEGVNDEEVVE